MMVSTSCCSYPVSLLQYCSSLSNDLPPFKKRNNRRIAGCIIRIHTGCHQNTSVRPMASASPAFAGFALTEKSDISVQTVYNKLTRVLAVISSSKAQNSSKTRHKICIKERPKFSTFSYHKINFSARVPNEGRYPGRYEAPLPPAGK